MKDTAEYYFLGSSTEVQQKTNKHFVQLKKKGILRLRQGVTDL